MKPLLAENYNEERLVFPLGCQPKIDGVRGLTTEGYLTGRSLKRHKNLYNTAFFSTGAYAWLDGEFAAADECNPALCRITSSALSTIEGTPFLLWHVFDLLDEYARVQKYSIRYKMLTEHVNKLQQNGQGLHLRVVPMHICKNLEELLYWDSLWLSQGYEGTIIRNLDAGHKQGRSTVSKGELLRIKRFIQEEAVVVGITEGETNNNEEQTDERGYTFRSSHQANKVPNGRVGSMECDILKDSELFKKGQRITVSKGEMTDELAKHYFEHPGELINHIVTFKHFPKGVKDKPRFPTWVSVRSPEDM